MTAALPLFGAFLLGLGSRRWLQRHVSLLVRAQLAGGIGVLAVLSGWSFHVSVGSVGAILILLVAQLTAVAAGSWLFRRSGDGPLVAFGMYGNPTFWSLPVATATLGAKAAVFLVAYDMLTQPRIALAIRFLRRAGADRPAEPHRAGRLRADDRRHLRPGAGPLRRPPPSSSPPCVAALGIAMALRRRAAARRRLAEEVRRPRADRPRVARLGAALHLGAGAPGCSPLLAGIDLPGAVWILALGPIPTSVVGFAQVYGYSARTAASGLAFSIAAALALAPLALVLAH